MARDAETGVRRGTELGPAVGDNPQEALTVIQALSGGDSVSEPAEDKTDLRPRGDAVRDQVVTADRKLASRGTLYQPPGGARKGFGTGRFFDAGGASYKSTIS